MAEGNSTSEEVKAEDEEGCLGDDKGNRLLFSY